MRIPALVLSWMSTPLTVTSLDSLISTPSAPLPYTSPPVMVMLLGEGMSSLPRCTTMPVPPLL
ncbi:hypothetical protein D3C80_969990 [compost metagenome]